MEIVEGSVFRRESTEVRKSETVVEKVKKQRTIICEFDTPRDLDIQPFLEGSKRLRQAGVDAITMADNSLASSRVSNLALGAILKKQHSIEPLVHITCRDRNLLGQQSHLMGLHALGIHQILIVSGDPPKMGDLPESSPVFDVTSFELIRKVKELNEGTSFSGKEFRQRSSFIVGTAFNPHVRKIEVAIRRLEKKIEAGADFVMTQPIYDEQGIEKLYQATKHLPIPVFVGIMPIISLKNALFLHHEVPGIKIADHIFQRMSNGKNREEERRIGVEITEELLDVACKKFNGIYLITPFDYWEITQALTRYIREKDLANAI